MKKLIPLMALGALALSACGDQKTGSTTLTSNSATGEIVSSETGSGAETPKLEAGKWEVRTQVSDLKMANMPAGMPANPPAQTASVCITPEQAAKGPEEMLKQSGADCTVTSNSFAGGKIESEVSCKLPGDMQMKGKTTGTFTPTSFTTDQQMEMTGKTTMSQKVHVEAKRIGNCDAK
ncbi:MULTISPECIES: DUF3617 domain-containing protein [unclassified Sphingomonas]|uniref:DUF3617 domain-containing protein n=1 Tax=unclassified Sphingomonas TaxID=196159 RepID=UPI000A5D687F|nr:MULTISPECIES: DUF3617 domain-containing protein [unclassified Sphingomonas]